MPSSSLLSHWLLCAQCMTHSSRCASLRLTVFRSAPDTCVMPHLTVLAGAPLRTSHMPPPLVSPSLAVLRSATDTCAMPHVALSGRALLCCSHMRHAALHSAWLCSALLLTHARASLHPVLLHTHAHASLLSAWLCFALLLTRAACLASLCLAVLRDDSDSCVIPHFTLPTCDPLDFLHMRSVAFHSHWLCSALFVSNMPSASPHPHCLC